MYAAANLPAKSDKLEYRKFVVPAAKTWKMEMMLRSAEHEVSECQLGR
jgi:hypothetical protein